MYLEGVGNLMAEKSLNTNTLKIDINSALHFISGLSVQHEDLVANALNLYSISTDVKEGKVKFLLPTNDGYITKARPAACAWDPISGMSYSRSEIALAAHNIQLEHCTEDIPGWEGVFGQGNDVEDLLATPIGQKFAADYFEMLFAAIGNDLLKSAYFGKHPVVARAKTTYSGTSEKFARIEKTLGIVGGWITMVDSLKANGEVNYNVQINPDNISGAKYTVSPVALFNDVIAAAPTQLKALISKKKAKGINPLLLVTGGIFDAYKQALIDTYPAIPDAYNLRLTAEMCARVGCVPNVIADEVLWFDGYWVKRMSIWDEVTTDLEVNHHRVVLTIPGNFALGLDVQDVPGTNGAGLRVDQNLLVKDAGKMFGSMNYRMGTALLLKELCVNASYWSK